MFSDFENENEISEFYKLLKKYNITNKKKLSSLLSIMKIRKSQTNMKVH